MGERVLVIPHIDADGLCSAALLTYKIIKELKTYPKFVFPDDTEINVEEINPTFNKIYILDMWKDLYTMISCVNYR